MNLFKALSALAVAVTLMSGCSQQNEADARDSWQSYSPELVAQLAMSGKPVFVEFSADWCGTCQANKPMIMDPKVQQAFEDLQMQMVLADWTDRNPMMKAQLQRFGREGVPLYIIYDGRGSTPMILPKQLTVDILMDNLNMLR